MDAAWTWLSWTLNVEHFGKDHSVCQCHCTPDILSRVLTEVYKCSLAHDMYWLKGAGAAWLMIYTDQGVQVQPGSQHVLTEWCRCLLAHGMYCEGCRYNLTHDMYWGVQVPPSSWRILMKGCRCSLAHDSADWGVRCVLAYDTYWLRGADSAWLMMCTDWGVHVPPDSWYIMCRCSLALSGHPRWPARTVLCWTCTCRLLMRTWLHSIQSWSSSMGEDFLWAMLPPTGHPELSISLSLLFFKARLTV